MVTFDRGCWCNQLKDSVTTNTPISSSMYIVPLKILEVEVNQQQANNFARVGIQTNSKACLCREECFGVSGQSWTTFLTCRDGPPKHRHFISISMLRIGGQPPKMVWFRLEMIHAAIRHPFCSLSTFNVSNGGTASVCEVWQGALRVGSQRSTSCSRRTVDILRTWMNLKDTCIWFGSPKNRDPTFQYDHFHCLSLCRETDSCAGCDTFGKDELGPDAN